LQGLRASRRLPSSGRGENLDVELSTVYPAVASKNFDVDRIKPLLKAALADTPDDTLWEEVYRTVALPAVEPRQPLSKFPCSFQGSIYY